MINKAYFSWDTAMQCVRAAAAAYQSATVSDEVTDTQVLITETENYTIVAFRGSSSYRDWISDGQCWRADYFGAEVHFGFLNALEGVRLKLMDRLSRAKTPLLITGHSLGGALAMLFADWLNRNGHLFSAVYTFGQPRIGNGTFARVYNAGLRQISFRFVHEEDIVPRIPGVLLGYRHAGQEIFFSSGKRVLWNPKALALAVSDLFGIAEEWALRHRLSLLSDHSITDYVAAVQSQTPEETLP